MYSEKYSDRITRKLSKIYKKDSNHYKIVTKKIDWILANPNHKYKYLRYDMKGQTRIHIGHFVLVFTIDHKRKIISFDDYDHHDKVY